MALVGSDFSWEGVGQVMHYDTTIPTLIGAATIAAVAVDVWKLSGSSSKLVLNGLNRMFLRDVERDSRAEAGAFLAAYLTGLPCFAFQPSAVEALRCAVSDNSLLMVQHLFPRRATVHYTAVTSSMLRRKLNCTKAKSSSAFLASAFPPRMAADPNFREAMMCGNGIHRILVWLLAGVAGEGLAHRQMIASDPRQAYAFLHMVRNRSVM